MSEDKLKEIIEQLEKIKFDLYNMEQFLESRPYLKETDETYKVDINQKDL
jgi:hypothetical protein